MTSQVFSLSLIFLATGCVIGSDGDDDCTGGKCDGDGGGVCTSPQYGDGTCDPQLDCAAPDIDCFHTFESDEAAAVWFAEFEKQLAIEQARPPRKLLDASDPRWASTRKLLDDGWAAFKASRPVGDLRDARPALVLIEDPTTNAFVAPDLASGKAGFAVMVQTGLFESGGTEEGAFGVMMHEFQHAVGLHVVGDTKLRIRKFYVAGKGGEPIGRFEVDNPTVREYGEGWLAIADEIGIRNDAPLGGLPLGGQIAFILDAAMQQAGEMQTATCTSARMQLASLRDAIKATVDPISGALALDATIPDRVQQVLQDLRTGCFASFTADLIHVGATLGNTTPEMIEAAMTPEDIALVKGKHVVDGIAVLTADRRAKMRAIESAFEAKTGRPWSALRYFSAEEDADDVTVPVLRHAKVQPDAIGPFFVSFLPDEAEARCQSMLDRREVPPYGIDIQDDHHGTCWRAHHVRQFAEHTSRQATRPTYFDVAPRRTLPFPRPLRDRLVY